uniref:C2 domain-containing protein n=1 Tax=Ciona savignyi TaxID=51511 RepID=H2ZMH0_CIOSA
MNPDIDAYLKSEKLAIYVFDDTDPEISSYLGKAIIDLIPLGHGKLIKAPFQLIRRDGSENGTIEVSLRWQLPYKSPSNIVKSEASMEDEEEIKEIQKLVAKPPVTPKKRAQSAKPNTLRSILPQTTSTPKTSKQVRSDTSLPPVKKVSIVEPEKEKPVPLSRSIRPKPEIEEDEVSEEDIDEMIIDAEESLKEGEDQMLDAAPMDDEIPDVEDEDGGLEEDDEDSIASDIPTKDS